MEIVISLGVLIVVYYIDSIFYTHSKNTDLKAWHWMLGAGIFLYFKKGGK